MKWNRIKKEEAQNRFEQFCTTKQPAFNREDAELREKIINCFDATLRALHITAEMIEQGNNAYRIDYQFGLKFYCLLNDQYAFTERLASDEAIWRYLSVCLVPDIVAKRYGIDHPDRFWKKPNRIWLRTVWWYIHLSWQGSPEKTGRILMNNSTDEILQLVDRCGKTGYRVPLCREIMAKYGSIPKDRRPNNIFRKTMVLNTARVQVIEPGLVDGGEKKYVEDLYSYCSGK